MLEGLRRFLSKEEVDNPRDWEVMVRRSYDFLNDELKRTEEVMGLENFQADLRAQRIETRIGGLRDAVILASIAEKPNTKYPNGFAIGPYGLVVYTPVSNELKGARQRPISFGFPSFIPMMPDYEEFIIDAKVWCLDKAIVE